MGYYIVPDIKNEEVVCQNPCEHRDCAANRAEWEGAICDECDRALTTGMAFYYKQVKPTVLHLCVSCAFNDDSQ